MSILHNIHVILIIYLQQVIQLQILRELAFFRALINQGYQMNASTSILLMSNFPFKMTDSLVNFIFADGGISLEDLSIVFLI